MFGLKIHSSKIKKSKHYTTKSKSDNSYQTFRIIENKTSGYEKLGRREKEKVHGIVELKWSYWERQAARNCLIMLINFTY